ncbi:MAG: RNA polymerase sigma factor RpoE [Cellvibrionales bacterium]|jgi:RNA polymerase sigma-70 factor (ECF subfamily)|nr:RNA polymerase sigma factor RpoE [Cellvibrionales bacterium]MCH9798224.1 RNA polymerase sigma factor RpoE [Gammaproteobacteria bacterium]MDA7737242.1 RNA polymerase sigma factor RpoE [Porticoccus sp.]MDC0412558.1 RNA polymerase sigma factor RpoE [Porticoccus sp.]MDC0887558.1 RNA polymerase sigma factor RpoE [Porticoccus sp.]
MKDEQLKISDDQLVARVQKGDKRAFDLLVLKHQFKVHAIVSKYVKDYDEVNDVVQETFIKAYRALEAFRGESAFYTWLYRIAVNTSKNYLLARNRRPPSFDVDLGDAENAELSSQLQNLDSPDNILSRNELETVIDVAIKGLPADLRNALILREFEDLSYEQIADIMDCPVGTVRSRIFRAREALEEKIKEMEN